MVGTWEGAGGGAGALRPAPPPPARGPAPRPRPWPGAQPGQPPRAEPSRPRGPTGAQGRKGSSLESSGSPSDSQGRPRGGSVSEGRRQVGGHMPQEAESAWTEAGFGRPPAQPCQPRRRHPLHWPLLTARVRSCPCEAGHSGPCTHVLQAWPPPPRPPRKPDTHSQIGAEKTDVGREPEPPSTVGVKNGAGFPHTEGCSKVWEPGGGHKGSHVKTEALGLKIAESRGKVTNVSQLFPDPWCSGVAVRLQSPLCTLISLQSS